MFLAARRLLRHDRHPHFRLPRRPCFHQAPGQPDRRSRRARIEFLSRSEGWRPASALRLLQTRRNSRRSRTTTEKTLQVIFTRRLVARIEKLFREGRAEILAALRDILASFAVKS